MNKLIINWLFVSCVFAISLHANEKLGHVAVDLQIDNGYRDEIPVHMMRASCSCILINSVSYPFTIKQKSSHNIQVIILSTQESQEYTMVMEYTSAIYGTQRQTKIIKFQL